MYPIFKILCLSFVMTVSVFASNGFFLPEIQPFVRRLPGGLPEGVSVEDVFTYAQSLEELWEQYPAPSVVLKTNAKILGTAPLKTLAEFEEDCTTVAVYLREHQKHIDPCRLAEFDGLRDAGLQTFEAERMSAIQMNAAYLGLAILISEVQLVIHEEAIAKAQGYNPFEAIMPADISGELAFLTRFVAADDPLALLNIAEYVFRDDSGVVLRAKDGSIHTREIIKQVKDSSISDSRVETVLLKLYRLNQLDVFPETYLRNGTFASYQDLAKAISQQRPIIDCGTELLSIDGTDTIGTACAMFFHDLNHCLLQADNVIFEEHMEKSSLPHRYAFARNVMAKGDAANLLHALVAFYVFHEAFLDFNVVDRNDITPLDCRLVGWNMNHLHFAHNPDHITPASLCSAMMEGEINVLETVYEVVGMSYEIRLKVGASYGIEKESFPYKKTIAQIIKDSASLAKDRPLEAHEVLVALSEDEKEAFSPIALVSYNKVIDLVAGLKDAGIDVPLWVGGEYNLQGIVGAVHQAFDQVTLDIGRNMFGEDFEITKILFEK